MSNTRLEKNLNTVVQDYAEKIAILHARLEEIIRANGQVAYPNEMLILCVNLAVLVKNVLAAIQHNVEKNK